jgi:hypothetical protein
LPVSANSAFSDGGGRSENSRLADASHLRMLCRCDVDLRHLVDPEHAVVVKLLCWTRPSRKVMAPCSAAPSPKRDAALDLGLDAQRVDRLPAVERADDPVHADGASGVTETSAT